MAERALRTASAIPDMLRQKLCCGWWVESGRLPVPWLNPQHRWRRRAFYKAFKNASNDGGVGSRGGPFRPVISTLAKALAFISMSTSA